MIFLLDTNAAIALINGRPASLRQRSKQARADGASIGLSSVALFELWFGIAKSTKPTENTEALRTFLAGSIDVQVFTDEDARIAGMLRAKLKQAGTPIGPYDLLIAAQAIRANATLVTANVSEFQRVEGLSWQDWSQ